MSHQARVDTPVSIDNGPTPERAPTGDYDTALATLAESEDIDRRVSVGRSLARLGVVTPGAFPQTRSYLPALLEDGSGRVRRAAADATVALAQTDPTVFERPSELVDGLRGVSEDCELDRHSRRAIAEARETLLGVA